MLTLVKLKLLTNGNMSTHPGLEFAPPPPIAVFLFFPDVKIAMPPLLLLIISMPPPPSGVTLDIIVFDAKNKFNL